MTWNKNSYVVLSLLSKNRVFLLSLCYHTSCSSLSFVYQYIKLLLCITFYNSHHQLDIKPDVRPCHTYLINPFLILQPFVCMCCSNPEMFSLCLSWNVLYLCLLLLVLYNLELLTPLFHNCSFCVCVCYNLVLFHSLDIIQFIGI